MDQITCNFVSWSILLMIISCFGFQMMIIRKRSEYHSKRYPPGPRGWPIIGNILDLGTIPHQSLQKLQFKYGPVLWLKLGSVNTMVVQSAEAASSLFKNHDAIFDRSCPESMTALKYNQGSVAFGRYSPYWRLIRRLAAMNFLSNGKMNESSHIRKKCIRNMINFIEEETSRRGSDRVINSDHHMFIVAFNILGNLMFSRDVLDPRSKEGHEFFEATLGVSKWGAKPNLAEFFPILKWLDPQGVKRNMARVLDQGMKILGEFIKQKLEEQNMEKKLGKKDFMDVLLEFEGGGAEGVLEKISDHNVKIVILEIFLAGSETTSNTLEWVMAELLRHPDCMRKAKEELEHVIGPNRDVEESDLENLPYLESVVKESLRLHPTVTLLLPRKSLADTVYMGYYIPRGTQVFVNAWAIGRDPNEWEDPLSFKPERFLGSSTDYKGQNFEFIPFGSGRRICMGMPLARRVVPLVLASLLHHFDWELGTNLTPMAIDMTESHGLSMSMLTPLKAIPKRRA